MAVANRSGCKSLGSSSLSASVLRLAHLRKPYNDLSADNRKERAT